MAYEQEWKEDGVQKNLKFCYKCGIELTSDTASGTFLCISCFNKMIGGGDTAGSGRDR